MLKKAAIFCLFSSLAAAQTPQLSEPPVSSQQLEQMLQDPNFVQMMQKTGADMRQLQQNLKSLQCMEQHLNANTIQRISALYESQEFDDYMYEIEGKVEALCTAGKVNQAQRLFENSVENYTNKQITAEEVAVLEKCAEETGTHLTKAASQSNICTEFAQ